MKTTTRVALALGTFVAGACSPPVDLVAARAELLQRDRAWAAAAVAGDTVALFTFWAPDAINYFPGAPPAAGREAIADLVRANRARPGFMLSWEPEFAFVAQSGDLGYTTGPFSLTMSGEDGERLRRTGHYVCIWKRQADGAWQCAVETTVFGPGP